MATSVGSIIFSISADLKSLQSQLRTMENNFSSSFGKIEGLAKNFSAGLLKGLVGGLSIGAVTGFGKEILSLADNLQNLSDQTGVSVQLLSGIKSPLEEAGTSMESFARGVFNLQKNLGNVDDDSDKVALSIKRLGLNLNDLRNSSPDEFIKKVTDALGQIENPVERNTILFNLLGKSAKELGPALSQLAGRFDELRAKGLTAADVKLLDDVGDALTRLKNQALVLGAEGVANILRFYGALRDVPKIGSELDAATAAFARIVNLPKTRVEGLTSKEIISQTETVPSGLKRSATLARDELLNLREEFDRVNGQFKAKPIAPFEGVGASAVKAKNEADSFLASLEKQLASLEEKNVELNFGPAAALVKELDDKFTAFKAKLQNEGLAVPSGLTDFFELLKDKIIAADKAFRDFSGVIKAQQAFKEEREVIPLKAQVFGRSFDPQAALQASRLKFREALLSPEIQRDEGSRAVAAQPLKDITESINADKVKTAVAEANQAILEAEAQANILNTNFINTFDLAAAKVEAFGAALSKVAKDPDIDPAQFADALLKFDTLKIEQALANVNRDLQIASNEAEVFGRSFDLGAANISAIQGQLQNLIRAGLNPANEEVQKLAAQLAAIKVDATFKDLSKDIDEIAKNAQVFGGAFDQVGANIDALTAAIKRLIAEGLDPLDPRIQELKKQLDDQKAFQKLQDAAERAFDVIGDLIDGNIKSWKDLEKSILGSLRAISSQILREAARDFIKGILKPPQITLPPGPAGTKRDSSGQPIPDIRGGGPLVKGPITEPVATAGKGSGEISVAGLQTASTSFQSSTSQFAVAVQQFAAAAGGTPGASVLTSGGTPPVGTSLGLNPGTLTGDTTQLVTSASDNLDQEFGQQLIQATQQSLAPIQQTAINSLQIASNQTSNVVGDIFRVTSSAISGQQSVAQSAINSLSNFIMQSLAGFFSGSSGGGTAGSGGLAGGILGNLFGAGGGAAVGFGSAPTGVAEPSMANGGFFSSALGGLMSILPFFAHEGGELADIASRPLIRFHTGGEIRDDHRSSIQNFQSSTINQGDELKPGEVLFIGKQREFVINDKSAASVGKDNLEFINREGRLPNLPQSITNLTEHFSNQNIRGDALESIFTPKSETSTSNTAISFVNESVGTAPTTDSTTDAPAIAHKGGDVADLFSHPLFSFHSGGDLAHRFIQNLQYPQLRHDEGIFIGKQREFIINDKSATQVGKPVLEFINREGRLPDSGEGGASAVAGVSDTSITTNASTSMPTFHLGGDITLPRYHMGGDVMNSSTRFATNDWMNSSSSINNSSLTSQIQNMLDLDMKHAVAGSADMRPMKAELHVHGVHDVEGFRRSRPQLEADFGRMMARAQKRT